MSEFLTEEHAFVARELDRHGRYLSGLFVDSINKRRLIKDKNLLSEFKAVAYKVDVSNKKLTFNFSDYGRFIEINYNKRAIRSVSAQVRADIWGIKTSVRKKRKNTNWYARNLYGSLNTLIGHISWGYTEEIAEEMRKALEKNPFAVPFITHKGI